MFRANGAESTSYNARVEKFRRDEFPMLNGMLCSLII